MATTGTAPRGWVAVAAAMFAIAWGGNEFTPLLVMYKGAGLGTTTVDLLLFAYVFGIVPALLVGGPLSDRHGRAPVLRPAPLIAATGSIVLACGADSVALLTLGRVLCGIALGLAMAVGGSWLEELSAIGHGRADGGGARRAAMSLTGGFAVGAGVAGVLAQWGPWPHTLAYLINAALCVVAAGGLLRTPETRSTSADRAPAALWAIPRLSARAARRFFGVALPVAAWLFACAAGAYAIMPTLMMPHAGSTPIAFSASITVLTLVCGFAIQSVARRIDRPGTARAATVSLTLVVAGMGCAAFAAHALTLWATVLTALVLGAGYGIGMVAGLQEVQRLAHPDDLARLTAIFYSVSYLGFGLPALLAALHQRAGFGYPAMFVAVGLVAAAFLGLVARNYRTEAEPDADNPPEFAAALVEQR
ncbi:MFS transporter [Nocardia takedensis]